MVDVSILVLTKNEQQDLPGCLQSVSWSDDVHVYDSLSTDETVSIASNFGAIVTQRPFDNWAAHQNWGLKNIPFKYSWVYYIDADERMTPDLVEAIKAAIAVPGDAVAFRVRRRDYFLSTWLKHVTPTPFNIRLFRPENISYERLTNPVTKVFGLVGNINEYFEHFPFSKGIDHWFDKHNKYSALEARQIFDNRKNGSTFSIKSAFLCKDANEKRFHQKELYYRLPFRPFAMFILLYVLKRGFLDGRAGFTYAVLRSIYEYMIVLKVRELDTAAMRSPLSSGDNACTKF